MSYWRGAYVEGTCALIVGVRAIRVFLLVLLKDLGLLCNCNIAIDKGAELS